MIWNNLEILLHLHHSAGWPGLLGRVPQAQDAAPSDFLHSLTVNSSLSSVPGGQEINTPTDCPCSYHRAELHFQLVAIEQPDPPEQDWSGVGQAVPDGIDC